MVIDADTKLIPSFYVQLTSDGHIWKPSSSPSAPTSTTPC